MSDIEARISALESELAVIKARLSATPAPADLPAANIDDPKYGDPVVRKDPPRWNGESFAGRTFSTCSPDYLRNLAGFLQWRAGKEKADPAKEKYARYSLLDASRALAWAERIEKDAKAEAARYGTSGHGANAKHTGTPEDDDGGLPFIRLACGVERP